MPDINLQDIHPSLMNPFQDLLVTELFDNTDLFTSMFSQNIIHGHALKVFQPGSNIVVLGPQGTGKTMLLNLTRLEVLADWLANNKNTWPKILDKFSPFWGISLNLSAASFHVFGRRSVAISRGEKENHIIEASAATDFISHLLFLNFIDGIDLILKEKYSEIRNWLRLQDTSIDTNILAHTFSSWDCWKGYYHDCNKWQELRNKVQDRLNIWRSFLNTDIDAIPNHIWETKADLAPTAKKIGMQVSNFSNNKNNLSLFVYIDQYEELIKLNKSHGSYLQRVINTAIKARDPSVFYRIGARTHDWGQELRVLGSSSRLEFQRDYDTVDLTELFRSTEDGSSYFYRNFAVDVACKRINRLSNINFSEKQFKKLFGKWNAEKESTYYYKNQESAVKTIRNLSNEYAMKIQEFCGKKASMLQFRLASAWFLQKIQRGMDREQIYCDAENKPWDTHKWWNKERKEIALVQIASHANQQRRYFGWDTLCFLSGGNISIFLMLCSEIWNSAFKQGIDPSTVGTLDPKIQTEGILKSSTKWLERDRKIPGGSECYYAIIRLGPAINQAIQDDLALSNPGHTGFSIREPDLGASEEGEKVMKFLNRAVNYAVFEERKHKSKLKNDPARRKYYLHPILSPVFQIPIKRVKEPFYVSIKRLNDWLFANKSVHFGPTRQKDKESVQMNFLK